MRRWRWAAAVLASAALAAGGAAASAAATPHSDQGLGRRLAAPAPRGATPAAIEGGKQLFSSNWSGYAQSTSTPGTFTAARDFWTVPRVKTGSGRQYSADWVGIDGFSNSTLVQDGTEADNVGGTAVYHAWTEILPASEVMISRLAIHPGDRIEGLVQEVATNRWQMTVFDLTTGKSGGRTVSYTAAGTSVEAIHERPALGGESLAALAKTGPVTFDPGSYSTAAPGSTSFAPMLSAAPGATLNEVFMVNNAGTRVIASPSAADSDSDGFNVADGPAPPSPPSS
jgi:hypothetical protein